MSNQFRYPKYKFALFDYLKNYKIVYYLSKFIKEESLSKDELVQVQIQQLKQLLIHAGTTVPFYIKRFNDAGFNPRTFNELDDLKKIPPLTRIDIQTNYNELVSNNASGYRIYKGSSSGSTGQPVQYLHDQFGASAGRAAGYLGWLRTGWTFGLRGLHIWGNPSAVHTQWKKPSSKLKSFVFNVDKFPAFRLVDENEVNNLVKLVLDGHYDFIDGYTNAIYILARKLETLKVRANNIKYILPTGENLHDFQKELMTEYLGPVFDCYGCGEINGIAYQTRPFGRYDVIGSNVIVELGESAMQSDHAPLIITHLHNGVMPYIRYQNGDLAERDSNVAPHIALKSISGRSSDVILLKGGGSLVVPSFFGSKLLRLVSGIDRYQVRRISENEIVVILASKFGISVESQTVIENSLSEYLAGRINYSLKIVEQIQPEKNGKYKLVIDETK